MPVEFLTDEQAAAYGTFAEVPMRSELERFFYLDDVDRDLIALRRTRSHQLGFALQLTTVRYVGLFLEDPLEVPWPVVEYLAEQLDIADPSWVKAYTRRKQTAYEHAWEIRDAYGYKVYEDHEMGRKFRTFLHGRAWIHAEGPVALFDHAVGWLRRHRVLLPGVHVLARQVSEVRKAAESRLHATVAKATRQVDPALPGQLLALLEIPEGKRWSDLERLRKPPTRNSGSSLAKALHRVEEISAFDLGRLKLAHVPPNRLSALARQAMNSKTYNLGRPSEPKRTALVCTLVRHLEAMAIDDALDLFALLMSTKLINPARRGTDKERLAMLPKLERASRILARASRVLIERLQAVEETQTDLDVAALWAAVVTVASRAEVHQALEQVESLISPEDDGGDSAMRRALTDRYNTVRPFLTLLGESPALGAASGGKRVLAAVRRLPALARRKVKQRALLPKEIDEKLVPPMWRRAVYANPDLAGRVGRSRCLCDVRAGAAHAGAAAA